MSRAEEKELLLKDLCARLLYEVKVNYYGTILTLDRELPSDDELENGVKPYLRPMSSMTEEEEKEFEEIKLSYHFDEDSYILFDWLNKHHFDYRGLIPKGLALEALEGMYNK